jgi:hypothetical protein
MVQMRICKVLDPIILAPALGLMLLSNVASAIEVGSIADSRFGTGWTLDGSRMDVTRSKLLDPANFGAGGTVTEAINITDVSGTIDLATLQAFDVFFIGFLDDADANAFTAAELQAFQDYVSGGGRMVVTCDDTDYDDVCAAFGPTPGANATAPVEPTTAGSTDPLFDGPFGTASSLGMSGTQRIYGATAGFTVLGEDQSGGPVVLRSSIGSGEVVLFTDVDLISDNTLSSGTGISNDNDVFLGNLFADLGLGGGAAPGPSPAPTMIPTLSTLGLMLLALMMAMLAIVVMRR